MHLSATWDGLKKVGGQFAWLNSLEVFWKNYGDDVIPCNFTHVNKSPESGAQ
jgi:hypothetical protein